MQDLGELPDELRAQFIRLDVALLIHNMKF